MHNTFSFYNNLKRLADRSTDCYCSVTTREDADGNRSAEMLLYGIPSADSLNVLYSVAPNGSKLSFAVDNYVSGDYVDVNPTEMHNIIADHCADTPYCGKMSITMALPK